MGRFDPDKADYSLPSSSEPAPVPGGRFAPDKHFAPQVTSSAPPGASTSWGETLGRYGQTADDFVRAAANAVTFGMADRLAGVTGGGTDAQVKLSEEARKRSPIVSTVGDVAGGVAIPGLGGARLANMAGNTLRARIGAYGLEGAAVGAAQGAGNTYTGNLPDYVRNAATGGAIGGVLGGTLGGAFGPRAGPRSTAQVPTLAEQRAAADMAYDALRANTAAFDPTHFQGAGAQLRQRLLDAGYIPEYSPGAFRAVDRMDASAGVPGAVVTPANIDLIRQGINRIPKTDLAAADRDAGRVVKNALDDFLVNPPAGAVLPGSQPAAAQASHIANVARASHAGAKRSQLMANMREQAENVAAAQNSGLNVENVIRQQTKNLLNPMSPAARGRLAGFNQEERQALRDVVHPGFGSNALRIGGNMLGGGGGIGTPLVALATGTAGGAAGQVFKDDPVTGGIIGSTLPFIGMAMRGQSNRNARAAIARAEELIAQRNPLYRQRAATAPMEPYTKSGSQMLRDAITAGLINQDFGR